MGARRGGSRIRPAGRCTSGRSPSPWLHGPPARQAEDLGPLVCGPRSLAAVGAVAIR